MITLKNPIKLFSRLSKASTPPAIILGVLLLSACGGGGGGGASSAPAISNAAPVVATVGTAISNISFTSSGGAIASYAAINPALSAGLNFSTSTGVISGTPTATKAATTYTVTARNVTGSDTATVRLTVVAPALGATPTGGAVGSATADKITLRWPAVAGADSYTVYRSTQSMAASISLPPDNLAGLYGATSTSVTGTTHTTQKLDGKTYYFLVTSTTGGVESNTFNAQYSAVPFATVTSQRTGKVWMSRNLGAIRDCERSTDTMCYGDLYQWGRAADGHQRIDRTPTTALANGNCWDDSTPSVSVACTSLKTSVLATSIVDVVPGVNFITKATSPYDWVTGDSDGALRSAAWADGGANDICPAGFSVPIFEELAEEFAEEGLTSVFLSFLKIPNAGTRKNNTFSSSRAGLGDVGSNYEVWNRSGLAIRTELSEGHSVRCIKGTSRVIAPSLANASAVTVTSGTSTAITDITFANAGGAPSYCTVSPPLPSGLGIYIQSCTITGTPFATQSATTHTVTGSNAAGSSTATVSLTVN